MFGESTVVLAQRERDEAAREADLLRVRQELLDNAMRERAENFDVFEADPDPDFLESLDPETQHLIGDTRDRHLAGKVTLFERNNLRRKIHGRLEKNFERQRQARADAIHEEYVREHPVEYAAVESAKQASLTWTQLTSYQRLQALGAAGLAEDLTGRRVAGAKDRLSILTADQRAEAAQLLAQAREVPDGPGAIRVDDKFYSLEPVRVGAGTLPTYADGRPMEGVTGSAAW